MDEWKDDFATVSAAWQEPFDRAVVNGFESDRIAFAFAGGYQSALHALVPELPAGAIASISITEEGGGHPKAVNSSLRPAGPEPEAGLLLRGQKKWATMALDASVLLVAAVRGTRGDGRKDIVLARVDADAKGLTMEAMPETPFAPEIRHAELEFDDVAVSPSAVLSGDGYEAYIKPFRTIEDAFVSAGTAGLLLRIGFASDWEEDIVGGLLHVVAALRTVAAADSGDPSIHVLLHATLAALATVSDVGGRHWQQVEANVRERWARDIAISSVAGRARAMRLEKAWVRLEASGGR